MEEWKSIDGYDGRYQVSNMGSVRSLDFTVLNRNNVPVRHKGKVLTQYPNSSGYMRVVIGGKHQFVHRLVAEYFVTNANPDKYNVVNHIDSNPINNKASNLEWTDLSGNMQHALKKGRLTRTERWLNRLHESLEKLSKPVIGYDYLTGKTVVMFNSIQEAGRNGYDPGCICSCCQGKREFHRELKWMYADEVRE